MDKKIYNIYKRSHYFSTKSKNIANFLSYRLYKKYNCIIAPQSNISSKIKFPHPLGVVIGEGVTIGKNCCIYQNVTIGQKDNKYPKIGNNVIIYANSVLVGDISIGDNCIIGANSFVNKSFPENSIIAGNPAAKIGIVKEEKI